MQLASLIGPETKVATSGVALGDTGDSALPAVEITGLTADSRAVRPGNLFAALAGSKTDGARFIADAVAKGAVAVLAGESGAVSVPAGVAVLRATEPRQALALMAARFYGPGPDNIVAVTGTSGKTSVAEFTRQIFAHLGLKAASLGTMGIVKPGGAVYGTLTTPGGRPTYSDSISMRTSIKRALG